MKRAVRRIGADRSVGRRLAVAVPVATAAVLAVQVQLARRGRRLADSPLQLDGRVGPERCAVKGAGDALRITWLGDSTAAGVGATSAELSVPRRVAAILDRPVEVTSLAVSGARIADVLAKQVPRLQRPDIAPPDVVAISVGANDVTHLTPLRLFVRRFEAVLDQLPAEARVVLLGVPDMGAMPRVAQPLRALTGWRGRRLAVAVRRIAVRRGCGFVDIAGATGRMFRDAPGRSFAGDQYHPSDEGYRVWAEAVAPVLQQEVAHARP